MRYATFIKFSIVFTLCVIIMGAWTRLADAGLGCPDWPGCYGEWIVPHAEEAVDEKHYLEQRPLEPHKGWLEMIHRYIAGTLGLLILTITVWSWRRRASDPDQPVLLPTLLLGVVMFQAALGMWTVTLLLKPLVVMGHLLGGFTTLSLLFLLLLIATDRRSTIVKPSFKPWAMLGLIILIMQIALGGWTSTNYAALACTDFPTCHGVWAPETDFSEAFVMWRGIGVNYEFGVLEHPARTAIHLTHRIGALITFAYLLGLAVAMIKQGGMLATASKVMLVLLFTQVALGISNVVFHLPLTVAVLHNLVAALLLLSVIYVNYVLWRRQY